MKCIATILPKGHPSAGRRYTVLDTNSSAAFNVSNNGWHYVPKHCIKRKRYNKRWRGIVE
jgi:hypothetical protein